MSKQVILIAAATAALALPLWCARGCATPGARALVSPSTGGRDGDEARFEPRDELDARAIEATSRVDLAPTTATTEDRGPSDAELRARLAETARAFLAHDEGRLRSELESLLAGPVVPRRVLALVEELALESGSLEEEGALLCASFACALEARGRSLAHEGRSFRAEFLDVLARLDPLTAEPFAEFAARLAVDGRPCIGAEWITTIARLRDERPEHAGTFDPLLQAILRSATALTAGRESMPELSDIVSNSNDPLTVQIALSVLVANDPENFVPVAERLFADSRRAPGLANAAVGALARHAPVDAAAASLAKLAREDHYAAFADFGGRAGAVEAAERRYNDLVASDADPRARKMLVSSMGSERPEVLLGIAQTDRSADVRGQALLTLTLRPMESNEVVRTLRGLHAARRGEHGLSTRASLPVAENVARNSRGSVRDEAIAFLRDVVADPSESAVDRRDAWDRLRSQAHPDEIAGLAPPP